MHVRMWPKWPTLKALSVPQKQQQHRQQHLKMLLLYNSTEIYCAQRIEYISTTFGRQTGIKENSLAHNILALLFALFSCFALSLSLPLSLAPSTRSSSQSMSLSLPPLEPIEFKIKKQQCIVARYHSLRSLFNSPTICLRIENLIEGMHENSAPTIAHYTMW